MARRKQKRKSALDIVTSSDPSGRLDVLAFGILDRAFGELDSRFGLNGLGHGLVRPRIAEIVQEYIPGDRVFGETELVIGDTGEYFDYEEKYKPKIRQRSAQTKKNRTPYSKTKTANSSQKKTRFRPKTQRSVFSARENEIIDAEFVDISD